MITLDKDATTTLGTLANEASFLADTHENLEYERGILEVLLYSFGGSVDEGGREMAALLGFDFDAIYGEMR